MHLRISCRFAYRFCGFSILHASMNSSDKSTNAQSRLCLFKLPLISIEMSCASQNYISVHYLLCTDGN